MTDQEKYKFNLKCACIRLFSLEQRQSVLINGNFTFHAKKSKVKVKDLRNAYQEYKQNKQNEITL